MGKYLHKLGDVAFRRPWIVIGAWLALLVILGGAAWYFMKPTSTAISIPGTDAQVAIDRTKELFPDTGGGSGRIVFHVDDGQVVLDQQPAIAALLATIKDVDGVAAVVGPFDSDTFISKSGTIAYAQVQLTNSQGSIEPTTYEAVDKIVADARSDNLQIELGGDLVDRAPSEIFGIGEVVGVLVALMVLLITLGSLVAAGMPIITALVAVGVSMAGLFALSQVIEISATTPVLAVMLGLAVGIDYSLFIISKYRSYVLAGLPYREATGRALGTAGNAVVFAALTVVIALAALSIVNVPFMTTMGLVGAASIAVAALVAITLIPALLGVFTHLVFGRKTRSAVKHSQKHSAKPLGVNKKSFWYKWGVAVTARPVLVLFVAIGAVVAVALPVKDLQLGLPTDQYAARDSTERRAYDLLTEGFGAGFNGPLLLVVEGLPEVSTADEEAVRQPALAQLNKQVDEARARQQIAVQQQMQQAATVEQQVVLQQQIAKATAEGEAQQKAAREKIEQTVAVYAKYVQLQKVADKIADRANIEQTLPASVTDDGTKGLIQVTPKSSPSSQATADLIASLRSDEIQRDITGGDTVTFAVTGTTALQEDINDKLAAALPQYLVVVVGLSLVLLVLAFRSILVPVKATLGFLLSVLAMFGAMVAVFQWGWLGIADAPGPIVSFIPIIATGILFGLAMDYEFFLVSGMHESYVDSGDAKKAVVEGFGIGSKVVTAAAVIMVSVFAGFVANHDSTIQAIGFGLAIGIFIDAFIVRMTIVPAVMTLLGKSAWWLPAWLERGLPHVSIEGE